MKTHTHTTGPWRAEGWQNITVNTLNGETIVAYPGGSQYAPISEVQANARLIAAAPEMLGELKKIAVGLSPASVDMQRENLAELCRVCREIAEAAISTAEKSN